MNRKIIVFFLIIILQLNFTSNSYAGSFVVLTKIGAKIGAFWDDIGRSVSNLGNDLNFFKKPKDAENLINVDDIRTLPKTDDIKTLPPEEILISRGIGDDAQIAIYDDLNRSQSNDEIFRIKGLEKNKTWKKIAEKGDDLIDNISENPSENINDILQALSEENNFYKYIIYDWVGSLYQKSNYFSKPQLDNKFTLTCRFNDQKFYFYILMNEKVNSAILAKHDYIFKSEINDELRKLTMQGTTLKKEMVEKILRKLEKNLNVQPVDLNRSRISPQELFILKDEEDVIVMSTQLNDNLKYPEHYFIIFENQNFHYSRLLDQDPGTLISSTDLIKTNSEGICFKANKDGLYVQND